MEIKAREPVILAADFPALVQWYQDALGFRVARMFDDGQIHYANLENADGVKLGIGSAQEMGIVPEDRSRNTVVLQLEVADVAAFFQDVEKAGGRIVGGPTEDKDAGFSFGSFADPEGNPFWVVDSNCP